MGIFKVIGELLSGKGTKLEKEAESSDTSSKKKENVDGEDIKASLSKEEIDNSDKNSVSDTARIADCSEETRASIKKAILKSLNTLYGFNRDLCTDRPMQICLDTVNSVVFDAYMANRFEEEVKEFLYNEAGYKIGKVVILHGAPCKSENNRFVAISVNRLPVWYNIEMSKNHEEKSFHSFVERKAYISIAGNRGKLLQECYELCSGHQGVYNIGRGQMPMVKNKIRKNNIVIDENYKEFNEFVSRSQAHIGFMDQVGFYLQVEYEGSRIAGNRTRIFRGEQIIELDNVMSLEPLSDGDLIELGKAVVLKFEEKDTQTN